jgi:hypothetical protein
MACRPAVGSREASIGPASVSSASTQMRSVRRRDSCGFGCEGASSSELIESIPDSVRLSSEWVADESEYKDRPNKALQQNRDDVLRY